MDFEYLSKRYEQELKVASEAESEAAREAHLTLANQYLTEIERLRARDGGGELQLATH